MKITVIGAGNVGATVAECIARKDMVDEVVLVDIVEGLPQGKALDIAESAPIHLFDTRIVGTNDYADTAGSDICVITAGLARKPVRSVTKQFASGSPNSILIVVSNPLDVMTYVAYTTSGFAGHRVFGMAGVLDTARYRAFIREKLGVSVRDIQATLMGGHGDTMVPLPRFTTVAGTPLISFMGAEDINEIVERTKAGGGEIVKLLGTSAWYAPGAAAAEMCEAIVKNSGRVLPCAAWVNGEYGLRDLFIGVPVRLGRNGVEQILELNLDPDELMLLESSAEHVRSSVARLLEIESIA
jgi:malate dehydrogenase